MIRQIIHIDEEKCNGCGLCAEACLKVQLPLLMAKQNLSADDYCDGMGDCLPNCPTGAISFETREAAAYDEAAVEENKKRKQAINAGKQSATSTQLSWFHNAPDEQAISS